MVIYSINLFASYAITYSYIVSILFLSNHRFISIHFSIYVSVYLFLCSVIHLVIYVSVWIYICLFIFSRYLFLHSSNYPFIYFSIHFFL